MDHLAAGRFSDAMRSVARQMRQQGQATEDNNDGDVETTQGAHDFEVETDSFSPVTFNRSNSPKLN